MIKVLNSYKHQFDYSIGFDSSAGIKQSVESLVREGLLGALFASLAVLLFLRNVRATVIAIVSIPLSLLVSAIFLNRMDITLNVMTLGGMAVAVGRVVDDSIVVIENIFRRVRREKTGMSDDLVEQSTKEIVKAIVSSTITTVVVVFASRACWGHYRGIFPAFCLDDYVCPVGLFVGGRDSCADFSEIFVPPCAARGKRRSASASVWPNH